MKPPMNNPEEYENLILLNCTSTFSFHELSHYSQEKSPDSALGGSIVKPDLSETSLGCLASTVLIHFSSKQTGCSLWITCCKSIIYKTVSF